MTDPAGGAPSEAGLGPGREFDRIRRILERLGPIAQGIGDDCAVVPESLGRLVVSVDLSVEGVHFRRDWLTLEEIGWRAAAAALSDLAAAGASAVGILASVGAPAAASEEELASLMSGAGAAVQAAGGVVLGGDLTASDRWVVDITVLGRADRPVTRRGARPGDGLWVTGQLGGARAALRSWIGGAVPEVAARTAFAHPRPRLGAGVALAQAGVRAMLDLSDGLGGDAGHLAAASGVALEIDLSLLPVAGSVLPVAVAEGLPPAVFAAQGGEDYELLAVLPAEFGELEAARLAAAAGVGLTRIGLVRAGEGTRFLLEGRPILLTGYDHFA